ncbi:MAG: hypothetical protein GTO45_22240 [Candidatus Aminicenantes bacterium]|nr:hypothetical protein [Candidatus Aminicenantes bacterium]NIM81489.1 hypothetical protein [Candidatus Aminicenantes bacterium]NIN20855.1 hypothetical protein [Candidatus Aminicenantes bacterium]NIN44676.1 hypothetical protein [Candidatus Aminicenantes bacterium]NIN87484.1 hypothetical protein [Candidatus Aminicenantes bacterium]
MNKIFTFLCLFLSLALVFAFAGMEKPVSNASPGYSQAYMERSPGNFDSVEYVKAQQERFDWLMAESVPLSPDSIISIRLSAEDLAGIENHQCETCGAANSSVYKIRVGLFKPVNVSVSFADLVPASMSTSGRFYSHGMMQATPGGGLVWTIGAESRDATALRIHLTEFSLPGNAALYIYNMDGQAFGPYTDRGPNKTGDFWTNTVTGPVAYLQLRLYGPISVEQLQSVRFVIEDIAHIGPKFLLPFLQQPDWIREGVSRTESLCDYNAPCVEDASCYHGGTWNAIEAARKAVAYIQYISGPWIYMCSGGLIADTDTRTQIPYFLTADHCIKNQSQASSLECYFRYKTTSCGSACYDPVGVVPRTLGSQILSSSAYHGDYCLLKLNENPPAGSVFLGWTSAPAAYSKNLELFRLSHPAGAPQAFSKHLVNTTFKECKNWPRGRWVYSTDVIGATEGGSSGSPVCNAAGQIVGHLTGGCGSNWSDVCDFVNNATVDGAFAHYFSKIQQWLDPQ